MSQLILVPDHWYVIYDTGYLLTPYICPIHVPEKYSEKQKLQVVKDYINAYIPRIYQTICTELPYETWCKQNEQYFYATKKILHEGQYAAPL